jgi:hypothetical protein
LSASPKFLNVADDSGVSWADPNANCMVLKAMLGAGDSPVAGVRDATADPDGGRFFPPAGAGVLGSGETAAGWKLGFASGRGTPICGMPWLGPNFGAGLSCCPISAGLGAPVWA